MMSIYFLLKLLTTSLATTASVKPLPSIDKDPVVCDRSPLDKITDITLGGLFPIVSRQVQASFYSLKNESQITVYNLNVPVLCEGMISDFPQLTYLAFDYVNLINIEPGTFQRVDKLEFVSFTYNRLTTIQKGVFDPVKSLRAIYLLGNHISTIQQGAFSNMPSLFFINLKDNKITSLNGNIFNGSPNISMILLGQNQISKIDQNAFNDLKSVNVTRLGIDLRKNSIEHFDGGSLRNISIPLDLDLEFNKIADCSDIILNCKDESWVRLGYNKISDVPDRVLENIASRQIEVYLRGNDDLPCDFTDRIKASMDDRRRTTLFLNLSACIAY